MIYEEFLSHLFARLDSSFGRLKTLGTTFVLIWVYLIITIFVKRKWILKIYRKYKFTIATKGYDMKKLLVLAAVTLASTSAFASKARLSSLSSAAHLTDVQTIFVNPADMNLLGAWATFETGPTNASGATANPQAEAGFVRTMGDARWGFYLGHTGVASAVRQQSGSAFFVEENPINLFYSDKAGEIGWGVGFNYSSSDQKVTGKQSAMGLTAGMRMGPWDASLGLGLSDTAKFGAAGAETKWTGKMAADLRAGYLMDAWYFYGGYAMSGGKAEDNTGTLSDLENSNIRLGMINTTKADGAEFFWGASYAMNTANDKAVGANKVETTNLPVVIGIEADAASWLVLRGSVTQTVLLSSTKTTPVGGAAGDTQTLGNNTTVAAGAGIKFNKFMLDGSLAAQTTGTINGGSLLANAGLTYTF